MSSGDGVVGRVVAADDSRLPLLWADLRAAGGLAVVRLLQIAIRVPPSTDATLPGAVADACWERLHCGDWSTVAVGWRDAFTLATLLRCEHTADIKLRLRALDLAALVGGNRFRPELDAALAATLSLDAVQPAAKRPRLGNECDVDHVEPALGDGDPMTGHGEVALPQGAGRGGVPTDDLPSLERFATRYMAPGQPVVLNGLLRDWPAMQRWHKPQYLMSLAGERTVPVELGEHYLSPAWRQQLMTVREFLDAHVLGAGRRAAAQTADECNSPRGYLAQHPLFEQVPALANDIRTPDYCTLGRRGALVACNAWLGPPGTVTPLHTDPHHNLLCQVVGTKHVRLYAPGCTPQLYAHAQGHVTNSSRVDVRCVDDAEFPLFKGAPFVDLDLSAGQVRHHAMCDCMHALRVAAQVQGPLCDAVHCQTFCAGLVYPAGVVALRDVANNIIFRQFLLGLIGGRRVFTR